MLECLRALLALDGIDEQIEVLPDLGSFSPSPARRAAAARDARRMS